MNLLIERARRDGREVVTPEDVRALLDAATVPRAEIAYALLRILGGLDGAGWEDQRLCAFMVAVAIEAETAIPAWETLRRDEGEL